MFKNTFKKQNKNARLSLNLCSYSSADVEENLKLSGEFVSRLNRFLNFRAAQKFKINPPFKSKTALSKQGQQQQQQNLTLPYTATIKNLNIWKLTSASKQKQGPKRVLTVIRSPFVFKKTREQFVLLKHQNELSLNLPKPSLELTLMWCSQLRLPSELKIKFEVPN